MCDMCEQNVEQAKDEIMKLMSGELLPGMLATSDGEPWSDESLMGMVICRAAIVIQNSGTEETNRLKGAPLSFIIGSMAGIAMEAEMLSSLNIEDIIGSIARNN